MGSYYVTESGIWAGLGRLGSLEFMNLLYLPLIIARYFELHLVQIDKRGKTNFQILKTLVLQL